MRRFAMRRFSSGQILLGAFFILLGLFLLLQALFPEVIRGSVFWPLVIIFVGVWFLWRTMAVQPGEEHRGRLLGAVRLGRRGPWDLSKDLDIQSGLGSVKIDLAQAQIPEGEHHVRAESWIGDVDVWVPQGLAFSATGRVLVGSLRILDRRDDGVMLERTVTSANYDVAARRVRIEASLIIGDVRIRLA
jgi:hypothetical protein